MAKGIPMRHKIPGLKQTYKIRKCLKCGRAFKSTGDRLCSRCHAVNANSYADAWGAGDVYLESFHE